MKLDLHHCCSCCCFCWCSHQQAFYIFSGVISVSGRRKILQLPFRNLGLWICEVIRPTAIFLIRKNAGRNQRAVYFPWCVVGHSLASSGSVPEIWVPGERDCSNFVASLYSSSLVLHKLFEFFSFFFETILKSSSHEKLCWILLLLKISRGLNHSFSSFFLRISLGNLGSGRPEF